VEDYFGNLKAMVENMGDSGYSCNMAVRFACWE